MDYAPLKEADNSDGLPSSSSGGDNNNNSKGSASNEPTTNGGSPMRGKRNLRPLTKSGSNLEEPLTGSTTDNDDVENGHRFETGDDEPNNHNHNNHSNDAQQERPNGGGGGGDDDPYYVFKDDLIRKLAAVDEGLAEYKRVVMNTDTAVNTYEVKDAKKQLKRHLKHAESTLKDLETTIRLVERQRQKFSDIHDAELYERRSFVASSQTRLSAAKRDMVADGLKRKMADDDRRLAARRAGANVTGQTEREKENTAFLVDQSTQSRLMLRQQDDTLDDLDDAVVRVNNMADGIHEEIQDQTKMLDDLEDDLTNLEEQMGFVMGKLGKFLKTKNRCQLGIVMFLCIVVLVLFFLVIYWR